MVIVASVLSLPPELLSLVFFSGKRMDDYPSFRAEEAQREANQLAFFEVIVSQVCRYFRQVALATPQLWATISVDAFTDPNRISTKIARSASYPLDIAINMNVTLDPIQRDGIVKQLISHSFRWRTLSVTCDYEEAGTSIIPFLCTSDVPNLRYLSITIDDIHSADPAIINNLQPQIFLSNPTNIQFVRLRGMAIYHFRPSMHQITILHLDQTRPVPILYSTFRGLITSSPLLAHLSVYGDIIAAGHWPRINCDIHMPSLTALRLYGAGGELYSGLLVALDAPKLKSLTLKDMQEHDLDQLWQAVNMAQFTNLQSLTFCDFDLSINTYKHMSETFTEITTFESLELTICKSAMVDLLLNNPVSGFGGAQTAWPQLKTLSFRAHEQASSDDDDEITMIEKVLAARKQQACSISCVLLRVGTDYRQENEWELGEIKYIDDAYIWPDDLSGFDFGDDLFVP